MLLRLLPKSQQCISNPTDDLCSLFLDLHFSASACAPSQPENDIVAEADQHDDRIVDDEADEDPEKEEAKNDSHLARVVIREH